MGCEEVLGLLAERETAFRAEADRLEAEAERIAGLLAACRKELERLVVAREVIGELPQHRPPLPQQDRGGGGVLVPRADSAAFADQLVGSWPSWVGRCAVRRSSRTWVRTRVCPGMSSVCGTG